MISRNVEAHIKLSELLKVLERKKIELLGIFDLQTPEYGDMIKYLERAQKQACIALPFASIERKNRNSMFPGQVQIIVLFFSVRRT